MCVCVVAGLPQRLKSTFFEIISSLHIALKDPPPEKKFQTKLILAFEANSTLSCQNGLFSAFLLIVWSLFFIISSERSQTVYYHYPVGQVTKYNVYVYLSRKSLETSSCLAGVNFSFSCIEFLM